MNTQQLILCLVIGLFLVSGCSKDEQMMIDQEIINQHLVDNGLTTQTTDSGLHYIINNPGGAAKPTSTDEVTVNYVGYLLDGTIFDSGSNVSFQLDGVIEGWTEGLQLIGAGGDITLFLPSDLAYGSSSPSPLIPPNSILGFDIELLSF